MRRSSKVAGPVAIIVHHWRCGDLVKDEASGKIKNTEVITEVSIPVARVMSVVPYDSQIWVDLANEAGPGQGRSQIAMTHDDGYIVTETVAELTAMMNAPAKFIEDALTVAEAYIAGETPTEALDAANRIRDAVGS
jgi:hypothetical protein